MRAEQREALEAGLRQAAFRLDVLDTGHLAWEGAAAGYGAIIVGWINGGYLTGSTGMGGT